MRAAGGGLADLGSAIVAHAKLFSVPPLVREQHLAMHVHNK